MWHFFVSLRIQIFQKLFCTLNLPVTDIPLVYGYAYREYLIFEKTFTFLSKEFKYNNFTHKIYSNVRKNIDY